MATFMLAIMVLIMATAVLYNPFASEWNEVTAVAKIMASVGKADRCSQPCRFFTGKYPSPTDMVWLRFHESYACPEMTPAQLKMVDAAKVAVKADAVPVHYTCISQLAFAIVGQNDSAKTGPLQPGVHLNPSLFNGAFNDLRIDPLYLSYAALPALLATGIPPGEALAAVVSAADDIHSSYRYPHVSQRDLVEAAAVQLLCTSGKTDAEIAIGLDGCGGSKNETPPP